MPRHRWPLLAAGTSGALLAASTLLYPGGTTEAPNSVGFSWTHNFFSSLFQPTALNGAKNPARLVAIPAVLGLCVTLAIVYWQIARRAPNPRLAKVIEISGIGTMVYFALAVTPLHNLVLTVGLLFGFTASAATIYLLFSTGRPGLGYWGLACFGLTALSAGLFWAHQYTPLLAVCQKLSFLNGPPWLLGSYYSLRRGPGK